MTVDNYDKSQFEAELKGDEPAQIHNHFEHLKRIGRAIVYEDGEGDHCIRIRNTTSNTHVNPVQSRYGHTKTMTNGHVAYAEYHQCLKSKFEHRHLVHMCATPQKKKGKSQSTCINGAHITLRSQQCNNRTEECFGYIRQFVTQNKWNSAIRTNGKLTVTRVNSLLKAANKIKKISRQYQCPHTDGPCFIIIHLFNNPKA